MNNNMSLPSTSRSTSTAEPPTTSSRGVICRRPNACDKWLKDRRGRQLSYDDLTHYQRMIIALKETIRLMKEVDSAVGEWPLE